MLFQIMYKGWSIISHEVIDPIYTQYMYNIKLDLFVFDACNGGLNIS